MTIGHSLQLRRFAGYTDTIDYDGKVGELAYFPGNDIFYENVISYSGNSSWGGGSR